MECDPELQTRSPEWNAVPGSRTGSLGQSAPGV